MFCWAVLLTMEGNMMFGDVSHSAKEKEKVEMKLP